MYRHFLSIALAESEKSLNEGQTPVAAILVRNNEVIGISHSRARSDENDRAGAIYHAELQVLLDYQAELNDYQGTVLYTTLEPCLMCMGAIIVNRIETVVWATDDYWGGALQTYDRSTRYIKQRLPKIVRTPYPDLQLRGAKLWQQHLTNVKHPEYIDKILKWQTRIEA